MKQRISIWRVYRVLVDPSCQPPLRIERRVADLETSGAAIAFAKAYVGDEMLVREVRGPMREIET